MTEAVKFFINLFQSLWSAVYDTLWFDFYGFPVTYGSVILAFLMIAIVANVWWKGAHS